MPFRLASLKTVTTRRHLWAIDPRDQNDRERVPEVPINLPSDRCTGSTAMHASQLHPCRCMFWAQHCGSANVTLLHAKFCRSIMSAQRVRRYKQLSFQKDYPRSHRQARNHSTDGSFKSKRNHQQSVATANAAMNYRVALWRMSRRSMRDTEAEVWRTRHQGLVLWRLLSRDESRVRRRMSAVSSGA
jgi:hypothetical protein